MESKAGKLTSKTIFTTSNRTNNSRSKSNKWGESNPSSNISTYQGKNADLNGNFFIKGPLQVAKYDEVYKVTLRYIGSKYNHRVCKAFVYEDMSKDPNLLTKPSASKSLKIIQEVTLGLNSVLIGKEVELIDKDGESYVEYQLYLEQYLLNVIKFNSDIENSF